MRKLLLAGTAIVGVALMTSPAKAELKLDLGGYFRGYGVWADNDEDAGGNSLRDFDFLRDTEVHFTGETTTDHGLTVGVHTEMKVGNAGDNLSGNINGNLVGLTAPHDVMDNSFDEVYAYFSGGWGRVNLGVEDGAAYLLQVAAPSADSNVDGLRVYIQGFNTDVWNDGSANNNFNAGATGNNVNIPLGYDHADFRSSERLTYLTPKWNGFQAGVSYAAEQYMQNPFGGNWGMNSTNTTEVFEDLWEVAARWDGEFNGFGISTGAGYSSASPDLDNAAGNYASDDFRTWNVGLNVSWRGWSLGGAYKQSDTGVSGAAAGEGTDDTIWVAGLGWDNGPWHAGASFYEREIERGAYGFGTNGNNSLGDDLEIQRWAVGGGYTYGPGMSFRGSVAAVNTDTGTVVADVDQWQVAIGTDINF